MIRIGLLIVLLALPDMGQADEEVVIDKTKLTACLWMKIGKDRLFCYRQAVGQIPPEVKHYPKAVIDACEQQSPGIVELACFDKLFKYPTPGSLE